MTRNPSTRGTPVLVVSASVLMFAFVGLCGKDETQRDRRKVGEFAPESAEMAVPEKPREGEITHWLPCEMNVLRDYPFSDGELDPRVIPIVNRYIQDVIRFKK